LPPLRGEFLRETVEESFINPPELIQFPDDREGIVGQPGVRAHRFGDLLEIVEEEEPLERR
jgi:hypothetical protein